MITEQEKLILKLKEAHEKREKANEEASLEFGKDYNKAQYKKDKALSDDAYPDNAHFIYEIIQNAEDSKYTKNINSELQFKLLPEGIVILSNQDGFTDDDIRSICVMASGEKIANKDQFIGEKGLGFRSVFKITDKPCISSNGYKFYFDKEKSYEKPFLLKDFDKKLPEIVINYENTAIYLPYSLNFKAIEELENDFKCKIKSKIILFLKKLNSIIISKNNKKILDISKTKTKNENFEKYELSNNRSYIIARKDVDVSNIFEEKRKNQKERELILSFPEDFIEDEINIFAFLPTDINSRLGFTIQADFLLDTSRGKILENDWNQNLFNEIKIFIIETIDKFKQHTKLKFQFLKYYIQQAKSDNKYIDNMYENILNNISKKELILTSNDNWQIPQNIILLEEIELESKYLKILFGNTYELKHKDFILDDFFINRFNIKKINKKGIIDKICEYFDSKELNIFNEEEILYFTKLLAKYLSVDSRASSYDKNLFEEVKKRLPIIPKYQSEKKYYFYDSIYISSEYKPDLIIENFVDENEFDFDKYNFLSNYYLEKDNKSLENFIRKIISEQKEDKNRKTIEFFEKDTIVLQKYLLQNLENNYKKILDFLIENQENNIEKISSIKLVYSNNETWLNGKESIYFSSDDSSFITLNDKLFDLIKDKSNFKDFFIKVFKVKEADTITLILNEHLPWLESNINKRNSENDDKLLKITSDIISNIEKFEKADMDSIRKSLYFISTNQKNKYLKSNLIYLTTNISEEINKTNSISKYLSNIQVFDFIDDRYETIFEKIDKSKLKDFFEKFKFLKTLKEEDVSKFIKSINNDLDLNSNHEALQLICNSIDEEDKKKIEEIKNFEIFSDDNNKIKISSLFFEKVADLNISFIDNDYKKIKNLNILRQYFASENDIKPFIEYLKKIDSFDEVIKIYKYLDGKSPETKLREHDKTHTITTDKIRHFFMNEKLIYDKNLTTYSIEDIVWKEEKNKDILVLSEIYPSELQNFFLKKIKISQEKDIKQIINEIKSIKSKTKDYFDLLIDLGNLITEITELDKYQKLYNGSIDNRFDKNIYENAKQFILKEERIFILENDEKCKDDNFYFNDLNVDEIPEKLESRIFSIDNKTFSINHFNKLIDTLKIKRLSQIQKEFSNREFIKNFPLKEYREILHFSYDLLFTNYLDEYNNLKNRKVELEEINLIKKISVHKDIICQIKIDEETIKVDEPKYYFENNILYIVSQNDIFKIISSKIKDINDKEIKDFFNDVIRGESSKNEYYQRENIKNKINFILEIPEYIEPKIDNNEIFELNFEKEENLNCSNSTISDEEDIKTAEQEREERRKSGLEQAKSHENSVTSECSNDSDIDNLSDIAKYQEDMQNRREKDIKKIINSKELTNETKKQISNKKKFGDEEIRNEFKSEKFYNGQCQVCGFTFPTNKKNYCERFTWTDFRKGKWTDFQKKQAVNRLITKGNSLCLCAKCHSIIQNGGDFELTFLNHEVEEKFKNENYSFDEFKKDINVDKLFKKPECFEFYVEFGDMFVLEIRLNQKNEYIYMTEVHLVEFFEFLKS